MVSLHKSHLPPELLRLWGFRGQTSGFWSELLATFARQSSAASAILLARPRGSDAAGERASGRWENLAHWPDALETRQRLAALEASLLRCADMAAAQVPGTIHRIAPGSKEEPHIFALALRVPGQGRDCVAIFLAYGDAPPTAPPDGLLQLMADTPLIAGVDPVAEAGEREISRASTPRGEPLEAALGLVLALNEQTRFVAAAMELCNRVASRFAADRVSLGWRRGAHVQLIASSQADRLNPHLEEARLLSAAMEECLDQDDEVAWPTRDDTAQLLHEHETYARVSGGTHLLSVPLRIDREPVAVVTLERHAEGFTMAQMEEARVTVDLVARRLDDLRRRDLPPHVKAGAAMRRLASVALGVEHTWARLGIVALAGLLAFLTLYPYPFRLRAEFTLQPEEIFHLPAPYDGYVAEAHTRPGDAVRQGDRLLEMDRTQLALRAAELKAVIERHMSEAQLARAGTTPTEMHIARARAEEARAQLRIVESDLSRATITAPVTGFVVEGDLNDRIGYPVTRGQALLKLSKLDGVYARIMLPERMIPHLALGQSGEAIFPSRPEERHAFTVEEVEPMAVAEEGGNFFVVRGRFDGGPPPGWWRPGMSGQARILAGTRSLLWIVSHRAIDFLRMLLWL